ncbi:unnamed protein product, partial [Owenia fusiformis]
KRSRVCQKSSPTDVDCDGSEEVTRSCNNGRCPDCSLDCPAGQQRNQNCTACECPMTTRHITVYNTKRVPLAGVRVSLQDLEYETIGLTNASGALELPGFCDNTVLVSEKEKYMTNVTSIGADGGTPFEIILQALEGIEVTRHPLSKVALVGDNVNFTCKAIGKP